jgi:hypothetical protein
VPLPPDKSGNYDIWETKEEIDGVGYACF